MSKFEENLDAHISKTLNEAKLNDELYKRYVQYVGALDALPQDQISTDWKTSDIHDQFGKVRPFSQWPTKTSRTQSSKVWLNYNQRLQLRQAAEESGDEGENPTNNPDFLGQLLDTCVRTSMQMGKLDRNTAFRHCSRQVKRFEQAVRGAIADRGLPAKEAEEFTKELLKGMANGKQIDMKDMSIEDRQFIQDLQDALTFKKKIKEDLDDKDEFEKRIHQLGDVDAYIIEYWGMSHAAEVMLYGARERGWKPQPESSSANQFEEIKTLWPDLYEAAIDTMDRDAFGESVIREALEMTRMNSK
jgi:hypothetical protein